MGSISSHRGRIVLRESDHSPILHFEVPATSTDGITAIVHAMYSLPVETDSSGIYTVNLDFKTAAAAGTLTSALLEQQNIYLVAYRNAGETNRPTVVDVEERNIMELEVGGALDGVTKVYISVVAGYEKPADIVLDGGADRVSIITLFVSMATEAQPDPDVEKTTTQLGGLREWPNGLLRLNFAQLLESNYIDDVSADRSLFYADYATVKATSGKAVNLQATTLNTDELTYTGEDGELKAGLYILTKAQ